MGEKLTAAVTVKLTDGQLRALQLRAEQRGFVSASEYMRSLLAGDLAAAHADYQALAAIFAQGGAADQGNLGNRENLGNRAGLGAGV